MTHQKGKSRAPRTGGLALTVQEREWDKRADDLVANFFKAKAAYQRSVADCTRLQAECAHLKMVVLAKQEVIEQLLPYYPRPISREMQAKIYLS